MKKLPILLTVLLFCATIECCTKQVGIVSEVPLSVIFAGEGFLTESLTKTTLDGSDFQWEVDDTVGIYPDAGSQIFFSMKDGAGTSTATFDGGGWGFKENSVYYSYYPFIADFYLDRSRIPVSYEGERQNGKDNMDHYGDYDYMYTPGVSASSGVLRFSYSHLNCLIKVTVSKLPAGVYRQVTISSKEDLFVKKGHFNLMSQAPSVIPDETSKEISLVLDNVSLAADEQAVFYIISAPVAFAGKDIIVSIVDKDKKQYDCSKSLPVDFVAGKQYGLGCSSWTEVPQSVGIVIKDWEDGGSISGGAE